MALLLSVTQDCKLAVKYVFKVLKDPSRITRPLAILITGLFCLQRTLFVILATVYSTLKGLTIQRIVILIFQIDLTKLKFFESLEWLDYHLDSLYFFRIVCDSILFEYHSI